MTSEPGDWDLIVDFIDVNAIFLEEPKAEDFETGDFSVFNWASYEDADWSVASDESHSGIYSARAGSIYNDESSALKVTLDCIPGQISFYYKVSSETDFDHLRFYTDGTVKGQWSGEKDWTLATFPVTQGTKTFEWIYSKDESSSAGSDTAWIDDIVFPVINYNSPAQASKH